MEFLNLLYLVVVAILAILVSAVDFVFLQQRWPLMGHGECGFWFRLWFWR
jgi:hypothetical protein